MSISRRTFLQTATVAGVGTQAALAASIDPKTGMPMRTLGKTGAKVSILGFGCGSRFLMYKEVDQGLAALNHAIDSGINYIDGAVSYGNGESERRLGMVMKTRRKEVWLVTKIQDRGYDDFMRTYEESLKRLQTDRVDLLHMHGLGGAEDLAAIEASNGALKALYKVRDQKMARFVGVTSHADAAVLKTLLERHDLDCVQMALNAARIGAGGPYGKRGLTDSFDTLALPVALKKNMGVTAMKVFGQEKLLGDAPNNQLVRYAMSLPVASAVIGMPKREMLDANLQTAKSFQPMPESDMKQMSDRISKIKKASLDRYFLQHRDIC